MPEDDHPEPFTVWRNWLAQRGLGLVPVSKPAGFNWPGPWLALLPDGDGQVGMVAYGSPPGVAWDPLGQGELFETVTHGYVIAPADVALWGPEPAGNPRLSGTVEVIVIAADAEGPMVRVERAVAQAERGLEGDRYFDGRGTFSNWRSRGHHLTLIDIDVLDDLGLTPEQGRRNVVTRGIDLNALVGRPFTIGGVECFGQRLCEPCSHLERLTPGTLRPLIHKGGLRADVLSDGEIAPGDPIAAA